MAARLILLLASSDAVRYACDFSDFKSQLESMVSTLGCGY